MTTQTRDENRIPVSVWRDGQAWSGWYVLHDGDREVELCSAYGSSRRKRGRRRVQVVAEEMLADAVAQWRARS